MHKLVALLLAATLVACRAADTPAAAVLEGAPDLLAYEGG